MDDFYTSDDYNLYDPSYDIDNAIDVPYVDLYDSGQDPSAGGGDPSSGSGSDVIDIGGIVDVPTDTTSNVGFTTPIQVLNEAKEGEPGFGWKYYTDGTAISPDGKYYFNNQLVYDTKALDSGILGVVKKMFGANTAGKLKNLFVNPTTGDVNLGALAGIAGGIYSLAGGNTPKTGGYKGTVPKYEAVRRAIKQPEYKPYSGEPAMGRRYFSDVAYVPKTDTAGISAAEETAANQVAELEKYVPNIAKPKEVVKEEPKGVASLQTPEQMIAQERGIVAQANQPEQNILAPTGGGLASGGIAMLAKGRYLRGATDGMADKIPSSIDNKQPAKLSHGEFVIPADVVSHLGNGNSDAGADVLYKMMDRVRKARTGNKKQGKRINPAKFTPGGIAGYAGGGAVAFQGGGAASTGLTASGNATTETSLAPWAGDAVTDYIGRGTALAKEAYIPYQGALSAGVSPLQQQAFEKAGGLGGTFDSAAASQYMNPYIQNALQPQLNELRRQADISQQALSGKFAGAGALGGARDAIARSEGIRNLLSQQSGVIGGAYKDAYDKAMQQYNVSRTQELNDLNAMTSAGQTQRGIEEEKIKADRAAFEEERLDPYQKIKFEQSLFAGLPLSSTTTTPNLSPLQQIGQSGKDITQLYDMINKWLGTK